MPSPETSANPNQGADRVILWIHALVLVGLAAVAAVCIVIGFDAEFLIRLLCVLLLLLYLWVLWSWHRVKHTLFDPYILFFTAALLFNGGQALLEIFNLNPDGILGDVFPTALIVQTLLLILLGLAFFHFGGLASIILIKAMVSPVTRPTHLSPLPERAIRLTGWLFLAIAIVPAALRLRDAVSIVISSGYGGLFQQAAGTGFDAAPQVLASFLVPAALFLLAGSSAHKFGVVVSAVLIFGYVITQFFLGSRSAAALPLIAYAWVYHRTIRRLPTLLLVVSGAIVLFIVFPVVQVVRTVPGGERLDAASLVSAFLSIQSPIVAILNEMGASMLTVTFTLQLVPAVRDFDLGIGYLYSLLTLMPNLFWEIHPSIAHGTATRWLVETVAPLTAAAGGGYGYSFLAEAYLEFGWIGAPLILALIGWLYGKLVWWGEANNEPARIAMVASFLTFFLFFARSESAGIIRALVWYAVLPYLCVHVLARIMHRHTATAAAVEQVQGGQF